MNLIITLLVMSVAAPELMFQAGSSRHPEKEPEVFYYDGKSLAALNDILVPNVRQETFQFFVKSSHELRFASIDSSEVGMCMVDQATTKAMRMKGRWYKISWECELKVGSKRHALFLTAFSGVVFKKDFLINVEGTKRIEKPPGVNK